MVEPLGVHGRGACPCTRRSRRSSRWLESTRVERTGRDRFRVKVLLAGLYSRRVSEDTGELATRESTELYVHILPPRVQYSCRRSRDTAVFSPHATPSAWLATRPPCKGQLPKGRRTEASQSSSSLLAGAQRTSRTEERERGHCCPFQPASSRGRPHPRLARSLRAALTPRLQSLVATASLGDTTGCTARRSSPVRSEELRAGSHAQETAAPGLGTDPPLPSPPYIQVPSAFSPGFIAAAAAQPNLGI